MLYKSSVLTAAFALLSILVPRGYANGQAIASELPTVEASSSSNALAQSLFDTATESAISRESIEPPDLLVSELFSPAATTPKVNASDVVVNPDLPLANLAMGYVSPLSDAVPSSTRSIAQVQDATPPEQPKKWAVGVHAQASTTGFFGVDGGYKFSPNLHARLGLNTGGFNLNYASEGIDYAAKFQPTNLHLLGDYFPFGGGLRLTGGLVAQGNKFTATAKSGAGNQINLNGTNYDAAQVGTVESEGSFANGIAPYLGIGFGTPISSGFGFNLDAGVMFAGSPTMKLSANNISSLIPTAQQNQIRSDLAAQEQQTNGDIKSFNLYPVISIGFSYGF